VRWGWIIALIGIGLFGAMFLSILMFARSHRPPPNYAQPPPPPVIPLAAGENFLSDDGAAVTGNETVITKTFPMGPASTLSINNTNGDVVVAGWDEPQAQVTVTKRGGSEQDRRYAQIVYSANKGGLSFRNGVDRSNIQVRYEIKVPHDMKQVTLKAVNSPLKLSDLKGVIQTNTVNGSLDLSNVSGQLTTDSVNGSIRAAFDDLAQTGPFEFDTQNGSITIRLKSNVNAQLTASSMHGSINVDEGFGLKVEKIFPIGQRLEGALGTGGQPIILKTMNGSIKITK
jgi:DUF4097 and DUF4098 domain-containing protein YvlB